MCSFNTLYLGPTVPISIRISIPLRDIQKNIIDTKQKAQSERSTSATPSTVSAMNDLLLLCALLCVPLLLMLSLLFALVVVVVIVVVTVLVHCYCLCYSVCHFYCSCRCCWWWYLFVVVIVEKLLVPTHMSHRCWPDVEWRLFCCSW